MGGSFFFVYLKEKYRISISMGWRELSGRLY